MIRSSFQAILFIVYISEHIDRINLINRTTASITASVTPSITRSITPKATQAGI